VIIKIVSLVHNYFVLIMSELKFKGGKEGKREKEREGQ